MAVPVRSADPIPALRGLVELPLRIKLAPPIAERLAAIEARFTDEQVVWPAVYQSALSLVDELSTAWESRLDDLQRQRLSLGDPSSLRQRQTTELRKELERARNNVRQALNAVASDWQPRLRRQVDYVLEEATKHLEEIKLSDTHADGELVIQLDSEWKSSFEGFLKEAMERWVQSASSNLTEAISKELQPVMTSLATVAPPPESLLPKLPARAESLALSVESKRSDVASFGSALLQSIRSSVMMVSMFGGLVAVLVAWSPFGSGGTATSSGVVRQYLLALAIPLSAVAGYFIIKSDRKRQRQKLLEQRRQEIRISLKAECQRLAERQRDALERGLFKQIPDAVSRNLETWIGSQGEPSIQRAEERGAQAASELLLKLEKISEEMTLLRTARGQMVSQTAVELRRRLRELPGAGNASPS